jgi:NADH-quinone oxidoreductase E subunit
VPGKIGKDGAVTESAESRHEIDWQVVEGVLKKHQGKKWALIPLLQELQQAVGYIPRQTIVPVAKTLGLFPSEVLGVTTFYAQFSLTRRGKNIVRVCRGTACHVKGGRNILKIVKQQLDIDEGETTEDFNFTLDTVACLGTCFLAPVMMVNRNYYGRLSPPKIATILKQFT